MGEHSADGDDMHEFVLDWWNNPVNRFIFYWLGRLDGDYDEYTNEEFLEFLKEKAL